MMLKQNESTARNAARGAISSLLFTSKRFGNSWCLRILFILWVLYPFYIFDHNKYSHEFTTNQLPFDMILHKKNKEPCALLFFGLMKSFETVALPAFRDKILKHNSHCDIFLHTYGLENAPANPRNQEAIGEVIDVSKAYLLTDHVTIESMESFEEKRKEFLIHSRKNFHNNAYGPCCLSHDNIVKQWNSIAGVWDLMRQNEIALVGSEQNQYYKNVGLFRSDTYMVTQIPDISGSSAVLPEFGSFGGVNDRMFYGDYENARIWSDRFSFSEIFEEKYMKPFDPQRPKTANTGYHSEYYLGQLLKHHKMNVKLESLCLWRIRNQGGLTSSDCEGPESFKSSLPKGYTSLEHIKVGRSKVYFHWSKLWDRLARPKKWDATNKRLKSDSKNVGVVVLSMHNSGSSMLSGLLAGGYGYHVGGDANALIEENMENLNPIPRQNDAFLWGQGLLWKSNVDQYNHSLTMENLKNNSLPVVGGILGLEALIERSDEDKDVPWLMKDPRLCITLKSWLSFLATPPAIVFVYRNPLEVAQTLAKEKLGAIERFFILWIQYNKAAIQNSMGLCRIIVEKSDLDENLYEEAERIVGELSQRCGVQAPPKQMSGDFSYNFFDESRINKKDVSSSDEIIETYNGCKIYDYQRDESIEGTYEEGLYIEAMKVYCDMRSGKAFKDDYIWPEIKKDILRSVFEREIPYAIAENGLRQMYVEDCTAQKISNNVRAVKEVNIEQVCKMVSPNPIEHSLARFIIFQRDSGHKLHHLVSHYTNVVPLNSIVVIDHNGGDSFTASALNDYIKQGMHVWRCEADFYYKDKMWSHVIKQYSLKSTFVFPLDNDEYMTILNKNELQWSYESFRRELSSLPNVDKPFKTIRSSPIPIDCASDQGVYAGKETLTKAPMCRLKSTESDVNHYCYNKCFFRGRFFRSVDKGNHHPNTTLSKACKSEYKQASTRNNTLPIPVDNHLYTLTNFTLLHMQSLEFSDFVLHIMRGATAAGFNKQKEECTKKVRSHHYCFGLQEFKNVEFDTHKMKEIYEGKRCQYNDTDPESKLLSLSNVMSATCRDDFATPYPAWNIETFAGVDFEKLESEEGTKNDENTKEQ